jgi:probable HAF family extracellular repeat protein
MPPGASRANAAGINDAGDLVGTLTDATTFRTHAFVHRGGVYTRLTPLPGPYGTDAIDINNRGDVLGTSNGGNCVVWPAGSTTPVQLPMAGRYVHRVRRINDNGDVIGAVSGAPGTGVFYSAALWRNGQFIDLGAWPGGIESYAYGINSQGTIVGVSNVPVGVYGLHAVTWTVTPIGGSNTAPTVSLSAVSPTTLPVGGTLTLRGTFSDPDAGDGPWAYTWRWGTGPTRGTWTAPGTYTASQVYTRAGTFSVALQVTDARGATTTSNKITVTVR